jgi:hypothetical protein
MACQRPVQVHWATFRWPRHRVYARLLELTRSRARGPGGGPDLDYRVLTSNVDDMFARNGFDPERVATPQGSYTLLQCFRSGRGPCPASAASASGGVWPSLPFIERALDAIDPATESLRAGGADAVPRCPHCGEELFLNVRGGGWFAEAHYRPAMERLQAWLARLAAARSRLVVLDIGSGYNTPGVIRLPAEAIVSSMPAARLVRVNVEHPGVSAGNAPRLAGRFVGLAMDADAAVAALWTARGAVESEHDFVRPADDEPMP